MSSGQNPLPNISNEEIRRRLTIDFGVDCGPVTSSTRRVHLKKLAKLENELSRISGGAHNNDHQQITLLDNSVTQMEESLFINGKHVDISESMKSEQKLFHLLDDSGRAKRNFRRYSPRRKTAEEIDAIKSFNVSYFKYVFTFLIIFILTRKSINK